MRGVELNDLSDLRNLLIELKKADDSVAGLSQNVTIFKNWANSWCEKYPTDAQYFNGIEILLPPPENFIPPSTQMNLSASSTNSNSSATLFHDSSEWQEENNDSEESSLVFINPVDVSCTPPPPPKKYKLLELANWAFETTLYCAQCGEDDSAQMILCEKCSQSFHPSCVGLTQVPKDPWECSKCFDDRETD